MIRHTLQADRPSFVAATPGGAVGAILFASLLHLAPAAGLPYLDLPRLVGGIFTESPTAAFWLGFWLLFLVGWLLLPPLLALAWNGLPGPALGFAGALLRGVLAGLLLWAVAGLLLPLFGVLNQLAELSEPGLLGFGEGVAGGLVMAACCLAYGVVTALIAAMPQGIRPLDALGWEGHGAGRAA